MSAVAVAAAARRPVDRATGWTRLPVATPGLVVDLDILDRNLDEMAAIARAAGVELYPHAKTHRMAQLGVRQIEHGADGLCVAKLGEAEAFAAAGVRRLFVANPIVGEDKARRVFMSARLFDAAEAVTLNLLAAVVDAEDLDAAVEDEVAPYLSVAPGAVAEAKRLARALGPRIDAAVIEDTMDRLVRVWEGEEAAEGIAAFFEKRPPRWARG